MLASNLDLLNPAQRLVVEQAFILANGLESAAVAAPEGQVIDRCETFLLVEGRDFLRRILESTIQSRVDDLEKKVGPLGPARVGWRDGTRDAALKP